MGGRGGPVAVVRRNPRRKGAAHCALARWAYPLAGGGTRGPAASIPTHTQSPHGRSTAMASFEAELDSASNIVQVVVTEDDGSEHDYQFDFDPRTGRWEFSERDLLERDFGDEWVEELEEEIERLIAEGVESADDGDEDEEGDE